MGKKGNKRKTRWRVLPIGGDDADCLYSTNEDDGEADHAATSPTATNGPGSYARAAQPGRGKPGSKPRPSGCQPAYYRPHRSMPESRQPLVTAEKKTFNEEEYTKITTPRQDVLFKKGYLGRKKTVASTTAAASDSAAAAAAAAAAAVTGAALTATNCIELAPMHNGGDCEPPLGDQAEGMSPGEEQPQYIYPNGYVDGVIYVNGGYEWYDPYGNVTVVVGPAPPFAGPGGGASVLAAVPCQPLPLQPIEWFNPAYGLPYVTPALAQCPRERDRRKRCSADSQNCSPQSSESTDPPGSPQDGDGDGDGEGECEGEGDGEGECEVEDGMLAALPGMMNGTDEYGHPVYPHGHPVQPHAPPQPQAYMYPGAYMFGQPIYSMNGITVQSTSQLPQNTDNSGSKRRKKKRRRRRRRGGVDDGSEETSSDEKDLEEPASLTSQESSQEVESDSKNSAASASCPTIVGCPELPERTPESPSSSPSLSPSLSPSPSSNATEDKTALPKVNHIDTNAQQENTNVRSEGNTENTETLGSKSSLGGVDEINSQFSYIPNVENSDDVSKLNETNLQTPTIIQNGDSDDGQVLVIDASKINGNYLVDGGKSFELDNNLPATDSSTVSACGKSEITNSAGFTNECVTKNNVPVSKQKSKGKKGLKNKQKVQLPVQNGFSALQINEYSLKSQGTPTEMDGNERGELTKDINSPNTNQSVEFESETSAGSALHLDDRASKSKIDLHSQVLHSPVTPKKPARSQHRQQQKSQLSQSLVPLQQREDSLRLSSTLPEGKRAKGKTTPCVTVPQSDQKNYDEDDDGDVSVVPVSESKLPEEHLKNAKTINLNDSDITESGKSQLRKSKQCTENDSDFISIQETQEIPKRVISDAVQYESKYVNKSPSTGVLNSSEIEKGIASYDTNENNKSDVQKSLSSVPLWATSIPPIPPPRRKKCQPKSSVERPPTPGRELEAKKQGEILDDSASSSSRESEESVIDLLSSSPNDRSKDTKEFLQEIGYGIPEANVTTKIFTQFGTSPHTVTLDQEPMHYTNLSIGKGEVMVQERSNEHASKPDESTIRISKKSQQISKGDQSQHKHSEFKSGSLSEENISLVGTHNVHVETTDNAAKTYAGDLAFQVLDEGLSSAATAMNKTYQTQSLSLTEAVTQWLHSQDSEEVLQVPQLLESESDIEDTEQASEEEIQMTGSKNVYRNPLLAQSCESENIHDDAGIRVANLEKNNTLNIGKEIDIHEKKMLSDSITKKYLILGEHLTNQLEKQYMNELQERSDIIGYEKTSTHTSNSNCQMMQKEVRNMKCEESRVSEDKQKPLGLKSEEWDSFTSESVEYDADWECDPVMLKHSSQVCTKEDQESNLSLESTDDKCSYMCDPTLSVAKYYRLGPPPEREINNKDIASDFDSGREDNDDEDEGTDALIHFRNELEEHSGLSEEGPSSLPQRVCICSNPQSLTKNKAGGKMNFLKKGEEIYDSSYDGFTSDSGIHSEESCNEDGHRASSSSKSISEVNNLLKRKSAILLSHLGAEGPFPCGGICCILQ